MKKVILTLSNCLLALFTLAQTVEPQGFFLNNWSPINRVNPTNSTVKAGTTDAVTATVTVDAANIITKVSKQTFGHNAAVWGGKINQNPALMNTIKNLSPNVIRWPGGNMSNDYFWNASSEATCPKDLPPPTTATSALPPSTFSFNVQLYGTYQNSYTMPLDNYYDMLTKTNSQGLICVNYAYARYGTSADPVMTAAKYAADWVRYDKGRTKYWEIGNENYGNWETGYEIDQKLNKDGQPRIISGDLYGKHAAVFISEMKKAAAEIGVDIKIGVVLFHNQYDYTGSILGSWNAGVIPHIATKADYLILHNYYTGKTNQSIATILNSANDIPQKLMAVGLGDLRKYSTVESLPIAMTEWNINAEGNKEQVSHLNGVHAALNLGEFIKNKWGMANRWDFLNGYSNGDSHGLFADAETDVVKYSPRAPFFYMYYFQKMFGDRMVSSTVTGNADIKSYASTFTSGQSGVEIVNKAATSQTVDLKFANFKTGQKYHYYILKGGDDSDYSRKVIVNDIGPNTVAGGLVDYDILQANETNIVNNSIKITLPKYSVVYMLVENELAPEINLKQGTNTILNTAGTYEFDPIVSVGVTAAPITFTIQNTGNASLNLGAISIAGSNPYSFVVSQVVNTTVAGGSSTTFTIAYKPAFSGPKSAIISIVNNDSDENPYTFSITAKTNIATTLDDIQVQSLYPYPNPSPNGVFQLTKTCNWKVYNTLGTELKSGVGNQINISDLSKGKYMFKMNDTVVQVLFE